MKDLFTASRALLEAENYAAEEAAQGDLRYLKFESHTVLGFLFTYSSAAELVTSWAPHAEAAIEQSALALRRAGPKAWNTYLVFLSERADGSSTPAALSAIEEDLTGTRKIARAGIKDHVDLRMALLTLLPIQTAPLLEEVDLPLEIRQRTTELPTPAVEAFLSSIDEATVLQILEEAP